jgi:hypothetical protein
MERMTPISIWTSISKKSTIEIYYRCCCYHCCYYCMIWKLKTAIAKRTVTTIETTRNSTTIVTPSACG